MLGRTRADLRRRRPPLRPGPDRGPRARRRLRVRGRARRRAALARAGQRAAAEPDPDLRARALARHRLRLLPGGGPARGALHAQTKDERRRRLRARRPARAGAADDPRRARRSGRSCSSCSATRSTSTRARPEARAKIRARRDTDSRIPATRCSTSRSTPGSTTSPGATQLTALAVLDRLDLDGLGRPRHERRLEHLALLGRGDGSQGVVARARDRRDHELLDLPAPRQPLAARARRQRALRQGAGEPRRDRAAARLGARDRQRPPPGCAGASAATSTACGRSSWTRARRGC